MITNPRSKLIAAGLSLFLLCSFWAGRKVPTAHAQSKLDDQVEPHITLLVVLGMLELFEVVGVTFPLQSARLNVTLVEVQLPGSPPPEEPETIPVELLFYDVDGRVVARSSQRLAVDRTATLHLTREITSLPNGLAMIRAVVKTGRLRSRQHVLSSFEIIDNATQQTTLVMKGKQVRLRFDCEVFD